MLKGFREFLMRGNVVDLAVAVIIGAAFTTIVTALNEGVITQLIAAIGGVDNLDRETFEINGTPILWGTVLTATINFVIVAAIVYFAVVVPMNKLQALQKRGEDPEGDPASREEELLEEIRDLLAANAGRDR